MRIQDQFEFKSGVTSKNRLLKSAMSEQLGDKNNDPTPGISKLYKVWAQGGIGVNICGNIMVDRNHLGEPLNIVIDGKSDLIKFRDWTASAKNNNTIFIAQLNHPGKQTPSFLTKMPLAPSAIPLGSGLNKVFNTPRELKHEEILDIIKKFATGAKLCKEAGFDGVQIHAAHGYLASQFLSPIHNKRKDQWGGSLENRMSFLIKTYQEIRKLTGDDFVVGVKLNSADFQKGGFSEEDSTKVIEILSGQKIDFIEISGGTYERPAMVGEVQKQSTIKREAYFLEYARKVRSHAKCSLIVTGGFRTTEGMNQALQEGVLDFIGIARPLAVEPNFPNNLLADKNYSMYLKDPTTGFKSIDQLTMLGITWYEEQFKTIATGKQPNKNMSAWKVIFKMMLQMSTVAFSKRRA